MRADAKAVLDVVMVRAKTGENWACKLVVERIMPRMSYVSTPVGLPVVTDAVQAKAEIARLATMSPVRR